ncbi:MAG: MFS transporter [Minwuia sp.]|uniref:MFS transporter n=1 Tax=Minwuia sp. TaxID=2493630 RepID=UPI003A866064
MQAGFKGRFGWAMYDWAAQPFFTIIFTFIFGPYFVGHVVADEVRGQALWGDTQTIAGLIMAFMAPVLGSLADATGPRKPWVLGFTLLCIAACFGLWFAVPNADGGTLALVIACVVLGVIGAEFSIVFNNAMLPDLAKNGQVGRLSGFGWAMGYVGGLIALIIMLIVTGQMPGVPGPSFPEGSFIAERLAGPFSGIWFLIFIIPFMIWTPDTPKLVNDRVQAIRDGLKDLRHTIATLPQRPNIFRFLIARMIYYDGLNAIFAFGGIYVAAQFGWGLTELGLFGIVALIAGIPGSLVGGWLDDRIGSKATLFLSVGGLTLVVIGLISVGDGMVFFAVPMDFPTPDDGLFASTAEQVVMLMTAVLGIVAGPAQAASRSMVTRLAPPDRLGQYFGLFSLSGKVTAFLAPFAIARVTEASESSRIGISVIIIFLIVGLAILSTVREEQDAEV